MEIIQVTTLKVASSAAMTHNPEGVSAPELCLYWDRVAQIPDHRGWLINELDIDAGGLLEVCVTPSSQYQTCYTSDKLVKCLHCSHAGQYNSKFEVKGCF